MSQPNILAAVGDQQITVTEAQQVGDRYARQRGISFSPQLMPMVVDQLVTQKALIWEAQHMGLHVSDAELRDELQHGPYGSFLFRSEEHTSELQSHSFISYAVS